MGVPPWAEWLQSLRPNRCACWIVLISTFWKEQTDFLKKTMNCLICSAVQEVIIIDWRCFDKFQDAEVEKPISCLESLGYILSHNIGTTILFLRSVWSEANYVNVCSIFCFGQKGILPFNLFTTTTLFPLFAYNYTYFYYSKCTNYTCIDNFLLIQETGKLFSFWAISCFF